LCFVAEATVLCGGFRAVLFDLGGTVIRSEEPPRVFMRIFEANGVRVRFEDVVRAHAACQRELDTVEMARTGNDYWVQWNLKLLERLGLSGDLEPLAKKIDKEWFDYAKIDPYPDAIETLHKLKALGVKTGIVTNGLRRDYQTILAKTDLTNQFDITVGVDDCHAAKPDRRIFAYALEKLNVRPEETIFVGDSREYDYEGAKQAELKPLLINRNGDSIAEADVIVRLTQVLHYVEPT
jgi:putative hydrolase of the HAD superfamily